VEVNNPDRTLRPGMTATVSIIAHERRDVVRVANIALRFKADPQDKDLYRYGVEDQEPVHEKDLLNPQQSVWMLDDSRRATRTLIKVGISDGRYTEVLDGTLNEEEEVIVGYLSSWKQTVSSERSGFRFGFRR